MQKPETRAAIYARIATDPQVPQPDPFLVQIDACKQLCTEQGYSLCSFHIYQEVCRTGASRNRTQLNALLARAQRGEFDVVVVFAYDRLAPEPIQRASLIATLENYGLRVVSVNEPGGDAELEAMMHEMVSHLHAAVNQMEAEARAKRRHASRRAKEEQK